MLNREVTTLEEAIDELVKDVSDEIKSLFLNDAMHGTIIRLQARYSWNLQALNSVKDNRSWFKKLIDWIFDIDFIEEEYPTPHLVYYFNELGITKYVDMESIILEAFKARLLNKKYPLKLRVYQILKKKK